MGAVELRHTARLAVYIYGFLRGGPVVAHGRLIHPPPFRLIGRQFICYAFVPSTCFGH